ncbi:SID1 transmembrane member 2 [Saguinus oedipus]|uniref:SID1 transmembrane member 2 n=1 Tax=Saguinus oedipus TaxID=9490 RepID=A0ABQ9URS7_SAGOE|nr:SID1 transmembrane member 2 [Saguinus oedipus]
MFALGLPFLVLLVASVESHLGVLGPKNVSQKDAEFERIYVDEVNSELVNIYTFNHTVTRNRGQGRAILPLCYPFGRPHEQPSCRVPSSQNHTGAS